MAILKIAQLGHPILRKIAQPVDEKEITSDEIQNIIDDMIDTLHEYGGVGLAAPQIHVSKQIVILESHETNCYPAASDFPLLVMINPKIECLTDEMVESWEGCLSIPDIRGKVFRYQKIKVLFFNRFAEKVVLEAKDFQSIVIQHENDHLVGKIFLDQMDDLLTLSFLSEYQKYWIEKVEKDD